MKGLSASGTTSRTSSTGAETGAGAETGVYVRAGAEPTARPSGTATALFGAGASGRARNSAAVMVWKKGFSAGLGGLPSSSSAEVTVWYTASNTVLSDTNFTTVLAGWTFTSTASGGRVMCSTQPGNLPFSSRLR